MHRADFSPNKMSPETLSEAVKRLKPVLLVELIEKHEMDQAIVFVRTQLDADNLESFLVAHGGGRRFSGKAEKGKENPFSCVVLHGGRQHAERKRNLAAFKEGDVRFLVCTDVAARGLDIAGKHGRSRTTLLAGLRFHTEWRCVPGLPYCINMTLPDKPEDYIHRIGRVGRADTMGLAISLVATEKEKVWFYDKRKWSNKQLSTALAKIGPHGNPAGGGCCMWYDEPKLLGLVEKRMAGGKDAAPTAIRELGPGMSLPEGIAPAAYGESRDEAAGGSGHLEELSGAVEELRALETNATISFYTMQREFAGAAKR